MTKTPKKEFESYPKRQIRVAKKPWEMLEAKKITSGLTWTKFIEYINQKLKK